MNKYNATVICPPSRRKASSSIQRKSSRASKPQQGALHIAKEKGLKE
jgi:hypothetical protein